MKTNLNPPCRYYGKYGIIRDIIHSHVLQTIALLAMEPPVSLDGEDIRNEKVCTLLWLLKPWSILMVF